VLEETVDNDRTDDQNRKREGHDDLARNRIEIREETEEICDQNEHEEREDEGEELHALRSC